MRIVAVDNDVAGFEVGQKLLDKIVNGRPCSDHQHDLARALELGAQLLNREGADDIGTCGSDRSVPAGRNHLCNPLVSCWKVKG